MWASANVEIEIIFVVDDEVAGAPLNNNAAGLDKGLAFVFRERFNASDACVSDWELCPLVAGNSRAGGKGQKIVVAARIASGSECDCAE